MDCAARRLASKVLCATFDRLMKVTATYTSGIHPITHAELLSATEWVRTSHHSGFVPPTTMIYTMVNGKYVTMPDDEWIALQVVFMWSFEGYVAKIPLRVIQKFANLDLCILSTERPGCRADGFGWLPAAIGLGASCRPVGIRGSAIVTGLLVENVPDLAIDRQATTNEAMTFFGRGRLPYEHAYWYECTKEGLIGTELPVGDMKHAILLGSYGRGRSVAIVSGNTGLVHKHSVGVFYGNHVSSPCTMIIK